MRLGALSLSERKNIVVAIIEGSLIMAGQQIIAGFIAVYVLRLGGTEEQVGLLTSLPFLLNAAVLAFSARSAVTPPQALRRSVRSAILHRIFLVLLLLAPLIGKWAPIWVLAIYSLASGAMSLSATYWTAVVSDMFPPKQRGRLFGVRGVFTGMAGFVATFAAGHLLDALAFPHNFTLTFSVAIVVAALATFYLARLDPGGTDESDSANESKLLESGTVGALTEADRAEGFLRSLLTGSRRHDFLRVTVPIVLFNMGFFGLAPVVNIYLIERLELSNSSIGTLTSLFILSQVVGSLVWGQMADRWGNHVIAFVATVGMSAQAAVFWFLPSFGFLAFTQALGGFCFAGVVLGTFNMIISIGGRKDRFKVITWVNTFGNLAAFIGPLIGTWMLLSVGLIPAFLGAAGVRALAALVLTRHAVSEYREARQNAKPRPHGREVNRTHSPNRV